MFLHNTTLQNSTHITQQRYTTIYYKTVHYTTINYKKVHEKNSTALQNGRVTKWYLVINQSVLQNCMFQNDKVTKQYVTKRNSDIMVRYIAVHYRTVCYTIFKNSISKKKTALNRKIQKRSPIT